MNRCLRLGWVGLVTLGCGAGATNLCANGPEDRDGFEDTDGCAEPDNDRDGRLDADDQCPLVPEDYDGDGDEDGCPESTGCFDENGDGVLDLQEPKPSVRCAAPSEGWPLPGKYTHEHMIQMEGGLVYATDGVAIWVDEKCALQVHIITVSRLATRCDAKLAIQELKGNHFFVGDSACRIDFVRRSEGFEAIADHPAGCSAASYCGQGSEILNRVFRSTDSQPGGPS